MAKSERNKTITTTLEEGQRFLDRCLTAESLTKADSSLIVDKTILGDLFEVCPLFPDEIFDLIIVDPPYNLTKDFNGSIFKKLSKDEYSDYTNRWICTVKRLLKSTGSIYVCCDWESSIVIGTLLCDHFKVRNRITWQREKGRGSSSNWKNGLEDIWFCTNSDNYTFNVDAVKMRKNVRAPYRLDGKPRDWKQTEEGKFRDTYPSNFWDDITIPFWSMSENTAHPTQKPEKLIAKLILASSNVGDLILDPFLGSGTTSVVAKKLGRHYVGVEINPQYCVWAEQRLEVAESNKDIQGYRNGQFYERNST